jgi:hypothetical protein
LFIHSKPLWKLKVQCLRLIRQACVK